MAKRPTETTTDVEESAPNPYATIGNKSALCKAVVGDNFDLSAKEQLDIALKFRADLEPNIGDVNNARSFVRKERGVSPLRTRRTVGTASISDASVFEAGIFFVEKCGNIEEAITFLERLRSLKEIL